MKKIKKVQNRYIFDSNQLRKAEMNHKNQIKAAEINIYIYIYIKINLYIYSPTQDPCMHVCDTYGFFVPCCDAQIVVVASSMSYLAVLYVQVTEYN